MKKSITIISFVIIFLSQGTKAQTVETSKLHALTDPITNCEIRYYYYFNIEAFYDTKKNIFYYKENGEWIIADEIPSGYKGYSMSNKMTVLISDYDGDDPTQMTDKYKKKYPYNPKAKVSKKMTASID